MSEPWRMRSFPDVYSSQHGDAVLFFCHSIAWKTRGAYQDAVFDKVVASHYNITITIIYNRSLGHCGRIGLITKSL